MGSTDCVVLFQTCVVLPDFGSEHHNNVWEECVLRSGWNKIILLRACEQKHSLKEHTRNLP